MADESLLQAMARNEPVRRGSAGQRLTRLLKVFDRLGMAWWLLAMVGLAALGRLLWLQFRARAQDANEAGRNYPSHLFVGFGAGSEEILFDRYDRQHIGHVARLNQLKVDTLAVWHRIGVTNGLLAVFGALASARQAIAALPVSTKAWRTDFLAYVGMRIGYYAYMHAWFERLKERGGEVVEEVAFLSADTAAFAAVAAGLPTCYLQHGMIRHSTLLPRFSRVVALTADEAGSMQRRLPDARITLMPPARTSLPLAQLARGILVASIYADAMEMQRIEPLIRHMSGRHLPIWVRPHPCEDGRYWSNSQVAKLVSIETRDSNFFAALERLRPRLVVSWFSTALVDALGCGIVPVTVSADDDPNVADMVYPLFQRSLRWPADAKLIEQLLDDDEAYAATLSRLRAGCETVPA